MKLGIIGSRGIPNRYGGFEQFASIAAPMLVRKGYDVTVYCSASHPYQESLFEGVHLVHCFDPESGIGTFGQFIYDFNCIQHARRAGYDVILQLGYTSNSIWHWMLPKECVIVTSMDGLEWKRSKYNKWVQRFLKKAEAWAVQSSHVLVADAVGIADYLQAKYNRTATHIAYGATVFKNADETALQPLGLQAYQYHLVIARLEPENNIETILEAHASATQKFPLVIVGAIANSFAKKLVQRFYNNVQFLGGIWDPGLLNNLRAFAALYIHGHSVGGTNPSLLEAMACGALIAAHDNEYNREVLQEHAFFFSNTNDLNLLFEIAQPMQHAWRNAVQVRIANDYSWDSIINKMHRCFQDAVQKNK